MPGPLLNHVRQGAGAPALLFVHGFLCRHQDWHYQVKHFARSHTVIACDLTGHGGSPRGDSPMTAEAVAGDVAALLAHHDLDGAILIGHSMGCRMVMEAHHQAREPVAGLVLVDGSRGSDNPRAPTEAVDAAIAGHGYPAMVAAMFNGMFFGEPPDWKDAKLEQVLAMPESTGLTFYRSVMGWDAAQLEPALAQMNVPVHIIQTTTMGFDRKRKLLEDGEVSPYQALVMERVPGATVDTMPAGHFCMLEQPDWVNASIERFLARTGNQPVSAQTVS